MRIHSYFFQGRPQSIGTPLIFAFPFVNIFPVADDAVTGVTGRYRSKDRAITKIFFSRVDTPPQTILSSLRLQV